MQKKSKCDIKIKQNNAKNIFALFCLLNAIGYDDENNDKGMSPLRKKIRKQLSIIDWKVKYPKCKDLLNKYHPGWILFDILKKGSVAKQTRIQRILEECGRDPLIKKMWNQYGATQEKEGKEILAIFKKEAQLFMDFVGSAPKNIHTLTVIANPLDAYWRGYGLEVKGVGYIVVGPGNKQEKRNVIRHELIHILAPKITIPQGLLIYSKNSALAKMGYGTKSILNREYVVRALQIAYETEVLKKDFEQALLEESEFPKIKEAVEFVKGKIIG